MTAPRLRLFDWAPSPFCLKVRAVLDHKGAAHERLFPEPPILPADAPMLCDFAVNAQLVYLSRPPASGEVPRGFADVVAYMDRTKALRRA